MFESLGSSLAVDSHKPLRLKVIAHVLDREERWDMPFVVSDVLPESDLVLRLDWFTSYHDVRLRRPSEGQIHIEPPRVVESKTTL